MVREAEKKDIPAIMELLKQVNNVHAEGRPDIFISNRTKYTSHEVEELLHSVKDKIFIHEETNGEADGYCFCQLHDSSGHSNLKPIKSLYIDDLCVHENCRGRKIGESLFRHAKEWAEKEGCHNLTLNVWSLNPGAISFYEKMGLTPQKMTMESILPTLLD